MSSIMPKKQLKIWFLLPLMVFVGLVVMFVIRLTLPADVDTSVSPAINRAVPSFELPKLGASEQLVSNADLPTQPFLLNVWGSWCITCAKEHPFLLNLAEQGVPIVGINYGDEQTDALAYLEEHGDPFVFSAEDQEGLLAVDLGLKGAPETYLIDTQGRIRQHLAGELTADNWQTRIQPCLTALQNNDTTASDKACR